MKYRICLAALVLRLFLVAWGYFQDLYSNVKYTDVDYSVFTDAANYVAKGESPYLRPTYRYTPLLAWILTPNIYLNINFGKLFFSVIDIANGFIIYDNVCSRFNPSLAVKSLAIWLFNPITLVVSTRGNAETLITLSVLLTLHFHHRSSFFMCGLFHGLAVHFKIYPIIYSLVLYTSASSNESIWNSLKPTADRLKLIAGSAISFISLTSLSYFCYGWPFLQETYLYHVTREDVRHNFSPYFYLLYLFSHQSNPIVSVSCFLPQLLIVLILSWRYRSKPDLSWALFVLTYGFVTFNKVVTSQYFLWYLSLLPLCLPELHLSPRQKLTMGGMWMAAQAVWLLFAFLLEFRGLNVMLFVWLSSLLFFTVNIGIICQCVKARRQQKLKGG